jgi:hypothetical protein
LIVAVIYYFDAPVGVGFVQFFEKTAKPVVADAGASVLAYFVTEHNENTFPALPVREGENVLSGSRASAMRRHANVTCRSCALTALARRNFEGTRATPEARAGHFEIIADDTLSFVKARPQFSRDEDRYYFAVSWLVFSSKLILTS